MNFEFEKENIEKIFESNKILKYPFNGKNPNLIDKILFIGYEQNYIEKYLPEIIDNEIKEISLLPKVDFYTRNFKENPIVLNEITYKYDNNLIDNSQIIDFIFPDNSTIIFILSNENNNSLIEDYKIIFSKNIQIKQNIKQSGLANVFFIKIGSTNINDKKYYYFIPYCICIISEFPFFSNFLKMINEIKDKLFFENSSVPIEILLYNTVKFTPSPINNNIKLLFGGMLNEEKKNINEIITLKMIKEQNIPELLFKKLSFYPILDFNLNTIFFFLNTETIIYIFIFTFLEIDIIFYSQNIELLNIIMFIFSNLNYPLNSECYYWDIFSVSFDYYNKGTNMMNKPFSTIIGIAESYDSNKIIEKDHYFVLDIDNKNFFFVNKRNDKYVNEINLFFEGIKKYKKTNIFTNSNFNIMNYINILFNDLVKISEKTIYINNNEKVFPSFFNIKKSNHENILEQNKKTQDLFYSFIVNILAYFLNNNFSIIGKYDKSLKKNLFSLNFNDNNEIENEFDDINKIFIKLFKNTQKYNIYINQYLLNNISYDLYKIPLLLTEEFIYLKFHEKKNDLDINYFDLMDYIIDYKEEKKENILKINYDNIDEMDAEPVSKIGKLINSENFLQMKNQKIFNVKENNIKEIINISFENFLNEYEILMRKKINREQLDSKIFIGKFITSKNLIKYKRKYFLLDDELLKRYIYELNNLTKEKKQLNKFFPKIDLILNQKIDEISYNLISEKIEEYLIQKNNYSSYTLIKLSLYNILLIMIDLFNIDPDYINIVTDLTFKSEICDRKYIIMAFLILYNFMNKSKVDKKYIFNKCFKNLISCIIINKIFVNKELLDIINKIKDNINYYDYDESEIKGMIKTKKNIENIIEIMSGKQFLIRYKNDDENELFDENLRKDFEKRIIIVFENKGFIGNLQNYKISFDDYKGFNIRWFNISSPKKLFIETKEFLNIYLKLINSYYLNKISLLNFISNQLFYFRIIPLENWNDSSKKELKDIDLNKIIKMLTTFYLLLKNNIDQ